MHLKLNALLDSQGSLFVFLGFGTWDLGESLRRVMVHSECFLLLGMLFEIYGFSKKSCTFDACF